jgi:predicted 3-demethylubiquinone-9 3-methyltransferase (glyoxalase superfamily)
MTHIVPHLWFDTQAKEAAAFYTRIFQSSRVTHETVIHNTPSDSVDIITLELCGQTFQFISAGPMFKFTPAVSFLVNCTSRDQADTLWAQLIDGGSAMMELGSYPFSERYGWLADRYGVSWQVMYNSQAVPAQQHIIPTMMFVGPVCGQAEAAITQYTSVIPQSHVDDLLRYGTDEAPDVEGTVKRVAFTLARQSFVAMDSAYPHAFSFTEAISFIVYCRDQAEMDTYWNQLSAVPDAEACGWLKDRYGFSWQIVPDSMDAMMADTDPVRLGRVTEVMLQMKKLDLAALQRAYDGA